MKRLGFFLPILTFAALMTAVAVFAQANATPWPYFVEIRPAAASGIHQFAVPLHVLDKAREDLADLRLFDANGREIPYAVKIRDEESGTDQIEGRLFNQATVGSTASEVSVDLGANPGEHNEVEIETEGQNFRRSVEIEGSDTGADWKTVKTGDVIFSFGSATSTARSNRVSYSTSRYRYLRVRVFADAPRERQPPVVIGVKVQMSRREKGEITTWRLPVPNYQLLRHNAAPASSWTIDLGARVPCDRLVLTVPDQSFSRPFELEVIDDSQNISLVASGELTKRRGDSQPTAINFEEVYARKLRLLVTDHSNPPLSIFEVQAGAPLRQVYFELAQSTDQPLRLYFGNMSATAPHYDFEKELQSRVTATPFADIAGPLVNNPDYQPAPLPFTERVTWLIYVVLTASSVALGLILFSLARTVTRKDAAKPQPSNA